MKYSLPVLLLVCAACAQNAQPVPPAGRAAASAAVETRSQLPPDTVLAKVGDRPITVADMDQLFSQIPADLRQTVIEDPKKALSSWYMLVDLAADAVKAKIPETSPYREQLEIQRKQLLAQAEINRRNLQIQITEDEIAKRYEADKDKYDTVGLRVIRVDFADPKTPVKTPEPGEKPPKLRTEEEARARALQLVKQARDGADFAELARNNSDDPGTAAKGGEFGVFNRMSGIPQEIKDAIFALKTGEVSEPIKQPDGFFVIKVVQSGVQPFTEVHDQISAMMRQEKVQEAMKALQKKYEVKIENEAYFAVKPATIPVAVPEAK